MTDAAVAKAARDSYGRLLAILAARAGDVASAEDALADAFAAALAEWPSSGSPEKPEAWLLTVARRKLIDDGRRRKTRDDAASHLVLLAEEVEAAREIPDERLAVMFACAHPALEEGIRAPLILQTVLGLDAKRIASAFLVSPAAMGKRLVRAKEKIREAKIPFRVPERDELAARLDTVLAAIYAAFTDSWDGRHDLADEALYLGHLVTELLPAEPEALGLFALMLHVDARRSARRTDEGEYIPFALQDIARWESAKIAAAETLLHRAGALLAESSIGRYQIEAALQSAHVHRKRTGLRNWAAIVELYDALLAIAPSPVVAINRALAIAERDGGAAGLVELDALADPRLDDYQPYWATRAELLARTGAREDATKAYEVAIGLERDAAVRRFLQRQKALVE